MVRSIAEYLDLRQALRHIRRIQHLRRPLPNLLPLKPILKRKARRHESLLEIHNHIPNGHEIWVLQRHRDLRPLDLEIEPVFHAGVFVVVEFGMLVLLFPDGAEG